MAQSGSEEDFKIFKFGHISLIIMAAILIMNVGDHFYKFIFRRYLKIMVIYMHIAPGQVISSPCEPNGSGELKVYGNCEPLAQSGELKNLQCQETVMIPVIQNIRSGTKNMVQMSRVMRKPTFCICENKDTDQLRGNREADQHLCFRYIDSTIPLLS